MEKVICVFRKNATETVKICLTEFRGHKLIDLRVYFENDKGVLTPSRKGLALALESLPELMKGIAKAQREVEAKGYVRNKN